MFGAAYFCKTYFGAAYFGPAGSAPAPVVALIDGSGLRVRRRHTPAKAKDRTPEDIRREQLEDERYLAELAQKKVAATVVPKADEPEVAVPVLAQPILADVAARAASAVQAKLEEAESAAALVQLAKQQRHRTLVLLLALD